MSPAEKLQFFTTLFPMIAVVVSITMLAWVLTTWMRIKNGYPLESSWGKAVYPQKNDEIIERVKLISSENAQLRAELGSVKDRLATVERIVTDDSRRLSQEIDSLRLTKN
jgi:predicted metal-binding membrane protein